MFNPIRAALYALLWYEQGALNAILDPIIVELLVTSILALLISAWFLASILGKLRNPLSKYISEHMSLFVIWVMFLVGAAIMTHKWLHLKHCRGHYKVCRILETIKAFSWMCFILSTFLILASLLSMLTRKRTLSDPVYGGNEYGTYPETRQARSVGATTGGGTTTTAYNNVQPTAHNVGSTPVAAGTTGVAGNTVQTAALPAHTTTVPAHPTTVPGHPVPAHATAIQGHSVQGPAIVHTHEV
ncbi:hypothetical protein JR316_0010423 [Psilocybe cubensis]|uniref:Uncharacterized protein n=1 Tax=Psilocybe cubensis TaxID=181762 RepID=A0ACB8GLG1_PSICU|nr:hypothetical protein JR316_0010423 [Psilocybe cubensis]KAH9476511.1 hypothetical protein JR316_0010423 [Psilocybe cubensis]